jgi:hypothetical protein
MKIYLSGKITGLEIKAVTEKFKCHQTFLELKGFKVVNPFELNKKMKGSMPTWKDYMINDIFYLLDCDAIYLLKDWGQSLGSRIEYAIAKEMGKKIFFEGE